MGVLVFGEVVDGEVASPALGVDFGGEVSGPDGGVHGAGAGLDFAALGGEDLVSIGAVEVEVGVVEPGDVIDGLRAAGVLFVVRDLKDSVGAGGVEIGLGGGDGESFGDGTHAVDVEHPSAGGAVIAELVEVEAHAIALDLFGEDVNAGEVGGGDFSAIGILEDDDDFTFRSMCAEHFGESEGDGVVDEGSVVGGVGGVEDPVGFGGHAERGAGAVGIALIPEFDGKRFAGESAGAGAADPAAGAAFESGWGGEGLSVDGGFEDADDIGLAGNLDNISAIV